MKNGYTLVELLGVIVLLTIITLLVIPNVINSIKRSNNDNDDLMTDIIKSAAKLYMSDNYGDLYVENGFHYCLTLSKLVDTGYLETPVKYGKYDDVSGLKAVEIVYNDHYVYNIVDKYTCSTTNNLILQDQTYSSKTYFLGTNIVKEDIEEVHVLDSINIPNTTIQVFDVSELQNDSIKLWYTDSDSDNLYEVYIASSGDVIANRNSRRLFSNLINVTTIDLSHLDTSNVIDMSFMFENCGKLTNLTISNLVTTNVKNTSYMFESCSMIQTINMSSFTTESLINTTNMFYDTGNLSDLNITSAEFRSVTGTDNMFKYSKNSITVRTNQIARTFIVNNLSNSNISNPNIITTN